MRSTDGFVSYAETVMQQPGYDDMPEAIMSYKFGSVLNSEGELVVAGYFIKLCSHGLLIGRVQNAEIIRSLSTKQDVLSYCSSKTLIPDLNPSDEVYELYGYDQVYLFDLFHKKDEERKSDDGMIPETKSIAAGLVEYQTTRSSLGLVLDPYGDFTIPPAGQQKVLFDDSHCNDTKIWAKNYLVIYDSGIKIKTMQKGFLGTWSKFQNPIEGGVTSWIVEETGSFEDVYGTYVDINKVNYDSKNSLPRNVYTIRYNDNLWNIMHVNLQQKINEGQALANSQNLSVVVEGVRFVVSDTKAYTRFPDRVDSENWLTIEKDWPTPFWGDAYSNTSYILNSTGLKSRVSFKTIIAILYGQSTWNSATKGSIMLYNYD